MKQVISDKLNAFLLEEAKELQQKCADELFHELDDFISPRIFVILLAQQVIYYLRRN